MYGPTVTASLSCTLSPLKSLSTNHTQMFMVFPQITQIKEAREEKGGGCRRETFGRGTDKGSRPRSFA